MDKRLEKIYNDTITHSSFLDRRSVEKCMEQSYFLGVDDVIDWVSKRDFMGEKVDEIKKEWNNKNNHG